MEAPHDLISKASLMLWEGLALLLIEKGVMQRDEAVDVVNGILHVVRETSQSSRDLEYSLELTRLLVEMSGSLAAASPAGLLKNRNC